MANGKPVLRRNRLVWALVLIPILLVLALYGVYMRPDAPWDPTPKDVNGTLVFQPHFSAHPGHYDFKEKMSIMSKVDILKLWRTADAYAAEAETFKNLSPIGVAAPDFELTTANGKPIRLSELRGKVAAFMFAAMTCPPARAQLPKWSKLFSKYDSAEVEMFVIYSRERHPGERGYPDFKATTSYREKAAYAQLMAGLTDMQVAVDTIEEKVLQQYGIVANAAFVIDPEGLLVFKTEWSDADKVESVIDHLLANQRMLKSSG